MLLGQLMDAGLDAVEVVRRHPWRSKPVRGTLIFRFLSTLRSCRHVVFVSYAHADKVLAHLELLRIRSFWIRVWYDEGIEPGSEWPEAIANALNKAAAFVVLITPAAAASRYVRNEISRALSWSKPFFGIHLVWTELPLGLVG
jgi:hypothetical protein